MKQEKSLSFRQILTNFDKFCYIVNISVIISYIMTYLAIKCLYDISLMNIPSSTDDHWKVCP